MPLTHHDITPWLVLFHAPGIGPGTARQLLTQHGDIDTALAAGADEPRLRQDSRDWLRNPDRALIERDLQWLQHPDCHAISQDDTRYPRLLREIADPPIVLFVRGNPDLLNLPQLAIVGSRNPSAQGKQTAFQFARHLASPELGITSGLALGIDAAAHHGALDGNGPTLAVMGTGADRIYPARNRELAQTIAERGAVISELPLGTGPSPGQFPRRNRLISGMSLGLLVVEAGVESGSLITARLAGEQGREVFAIPGSIHNPLSKGCHRLIKDGAKLVECADDILGELHFGQAAASELLRHDLDLDSESRHILELLSAAPASIDTLVAHSRLPAEMISSILLVLELHNLVSSSGGLYCRL